MTDLYGGQSITSQARAAEPGPFLLTRAYWFNQRRVTGKDHDGHPVERWIKKLAHTGPLTQFAYGTDTPSDWTGRDLQQCVICAPHTGLLGIDVDSWARLAGTTLGRLLAPHRPAIIRQGGERRHYWIDARAVPPALWPRQGALYGDKDIGHLKTNGFLPVPGSRHYSEELYEPTGQTTHIITATPDLIAAITEARAVPSASNGSGGHAGSGGGQDDEISAQVLGWIRSAMNAGLDPRDPAVNEQVYQLWLQVAISDDPSWPWTREDDFDRHYRTALHKALTTDPASAAPDAMAWALSTVRPPQQARSVRRPGARRPGVRT